MDRNAEAAPNAQASQLAAVNRVTLTPLVQGVLDSETAEFAQAIWNTSRIRELADSAYHARLQAVTSMAFTLGFLGTLWAGVAIDRFGLVALAGGVAVLDLLSAAVGI
jgi:hypothetical protein